MHGPVPQASPPQPQVSHSITSAGTPSVARSAASLLQPHSEHGVEPTRSGRSAALPGCQGVRPTRERCFLAARAGCGAATNSRHAFLGHFRRFCPIYSCNNPRERWEEGGRRAAKAKRAHTRTRGDTGTGTPKTKWHYPRNSLRCPLARPTPYRPIHILVGPTRT